MIKQNVTGVQWMASETWTSSAILQTPHFMPYLRGTLGIAVHRGEIPGLKDFLLKIHPDNDPESRQENSIVSEYFGSFRILAISD